MSTRNAVKKFVYENQGLVRRMYGDMRHIFVMQSELDNEVDFDDLRHSADKYSKTFNQRQMRTKKTVADRKNFRSDSEPYFRPAQRPSAINSKQKTKPPKVASSEQQDNNVLIDNMIKTNLEAIVEEPKSSGENPAMLDASRKTTKLTSVTLSSTTPSGVSKLNNDEAFTASDATTVDKVVLNLFNNISSALSSTTMTTLRTSPIQSTVDESTEKLSSTLRNELISSNDLKVVEEELVKGIVNDLEELASGNVETIIENDAVDRNTSKEPATTTTETQLFQDTVGRDKEPAPTVNRRGV